MHTGQDHRIRPHHYQLSRSSVCPSRSTQRCPRQFQPLRHWPCRLPLLRQRPPPHPPPRQPRNPHHNRPQPSKCRPQARPPQPVPWLRPSKSQLQQRRNRWQLRFLNQPSPLSRNPRRRQNLNRRQPSTPSTPLTSNNQHLKQQSSPHRNPHRCRCRAPLTSRPMCWARSMPSDPRLALGQSHWTPTSPSSHETGRNRWRQVVSSSTVLVTN